jgi:hypothetical protein
MSQVRQYFA